MAAYDDEWAANYARRAEAAIPGRDGLYRLCCSALRDLPEGASVLVVGSGTGEELLRLAQAHPTARFVCLEPAEAMRAVCERRVADAGIAARVTLRGETLAAFETRERFAGATSVLVSQHVTDDGAAAAFFRALAALLAPGAWLYSADIHLAAGQDERLMRAAWENQARRAGLEEAAIEYLLAQLGVDPRLRREEVIVGFLRDAGFVDVHKLFGATIYGSWAARR
ncbi:MAG: class I SAM-dependent methyltransferase [Deltaproteobacteria bacterium]|nr:class I SAM-dependent methyltransferase [Deltaproteobacteria bacterium]